MSTTVVNVKSSKYDVMADRSTIFGNPYHIGKDGSREEVIGLHKLYFYKRVAVDPEFLKAVLSLKGKIVGCWCKPLPCHVDTIAEFVDIIYPLWILI
jgi:hypothetical protein